MKHCKPKELSLKAYFLGPQAENDSFIKTEALQILNEYCHWRKAQFPEDGKAISRKDQNNPLYLRKKSSLVDHLSKLRSRFQKEIPQHSPRYMGHMYSELSLPGILGHLTAMLHNPNNISRESSHVGIEIESEAISFLCQMFGWKHGAGHFTSGGSIANLEACLRMRESLSAEERKRNPQIILSDAAHYSWKKALTITGFDSSNCCVIPLDKNGHLSTTELSKKLNKFKKDKTPILGLVSLFGSTELGSVDDLESIQKAINKSGLRIWHHVDAAYGGYFACTQQARGSYLHRQISALKNVHSLTLDPHKLGYVPYGCGAFLCRKQEFYHYAELDIPYIQFSSNKDRGLQTIEGSRPATGPTATWLIAKTIGLNKNGMGLILGRHLEAKNVLLNSLKAAFVNFVDVPGLDLNIICWTMKPKNKHLSGANKLVQNLYSSLPEGKNPYFVAKTTMNLNTHLWLREHLEKSGLKIDTDHCDFLRMTMMNPFSLSKESETRFIEEFINRVKVKSPR